MTTPEDGAERSPGGRGERLCWLFAALAVLYAYGIHHGHRAGPDAGEPLDLVPAARLPDREWSWLAWAFETTRRAMLVSRCRRGGCSAAPSSLAGRSAVARGLAS